MHQIDAVALKIPVLLNDFFRHLHQRRKLSVFLCGKEPTDHRFDLRFEIKRLLENRMGCAPFLGEEILELQGAPKPDKDHLTVEVSHAERCDLIVMFLGSPGTIAEVTAFAMKDSTNPKLVVFNDQEHRGKNSFLNLGPLKLIDKDRVLYYDPRSGSPSLDMIIGLDKIIAERWSIKAGFEGWFEESLTFQELMTLALVYSAYPVRYSELATLSDINEHVLTKVLRRLMNLGLCEKREMKFVPTTSLESTLFGTGFIGDVSHVRTSLLNMRMKNANNVSDFRLVF